MKKITNRSDFEHALSDAWDAIRPFIRVGAAGAFADAATCPSPYENRYRALLALGEREGWLSA